MSEANLNDGNGKRAPAGNEGVAARALRTAVRAGTDAPGSFVITIRGERVCIALARPANALELSPASARAFGEALLEAARRIEANR